MTPEHRVDKCLPPLAPPDAGAEDRAWIRRGGEAAVDDAGSVVWAWRVAARRTQVDVAAVLGTTQQHLSQIEKGQRPVSLELRREMVTELGIAPEDLGLSAGQSQKLVSRDGASPEIAFESRPSYRLLDVSLGQRRLEFGLANYFDKIDICEALAHEVAGACMAEGLPSLPERLRGGGCPSGR